MPIYALGALSPTIDSEAYVHPDAVVIGDVRLGPEASVWPHAVLRGDFDTISVGAQATIEDGSVIHVGTGRPTTIGTGCVIGHVVHMDGCTTEDDVLIGSGAVVLQMVHVGKGAIVAANALVPAGTVIPPGAMAMGIPARIREGHHPLSRIQTTAQVYVATARRYRMDLRRLD